MSKGYLTTHVLNTALGIPAEGITITAYRVADGKRDELARMTTNTDGRTDSPILPEGEFPAGDYWLIFDVGPYIARHFPDQGKPFYDQIPVPFSTTDGDAHYHVPLLLSPYGYSTYRGS
ncbi:MAG: hydroxyisourate hydrolase [Alphaproteobacteria bacterium]|nr:hydroxyisourate hydrolase [Alphaproteobacteria bacterium]